MTLVIKKILLHPFPHLFSLQPAAKRACRTGDCPTHTYPFPARLQVAYDWSFHFNPSHFTWTILVLFKQFWFFSTNNSDPFARTILVLFNEQFLSFFTQTILDLLAEQFWTFLALLPRQSCWLCYMDNPSTFTWTILAPLPGQFWLRFLDNSSSNTWSILTLTWVNSGIYTNNLGPLTWTILVPLPWQFWSRYLDNSGSDTWILADFWTILAPIPGRFWPLLGSCYLDNPGPVGIVGEVLLLLDNLFHHQHKVGMLL